MADGKKYDQSKAPVAQGCFNYFPRALLAVAEISKYGVEKYKVPYADKNFAKVNDALNRYADAAARHKLYEIIDGPYDPESKYLHAAHAAWNELARLEMMLADGTPLHNMVESAPSPSIDELLEQKFAERRASLDAYITDDESSEE
jgi:hypothetical protein